MKNSGLLQGNRKIILLGVMVLIGAIMLNMVSADSIITSSPTTNSIGGVGSTQWLYQTFNVTSTSTISNVSLRFYITTGLTGKMFVMLRNVVAGDIPNATANLSVGEINLAGLTDSDSEIWYNITMPSYSMLGNNRYAIVMASPASPVTNSIKMRLNDPGGYINGTGGTSSVGGSSFSTQSWDLGFYIFGPIATSVQSITLDYPSFGASISDTGTYLNASFYNSGFNYTWRNATYYVWKDSTLFNQTFRTLGSPFVNVTNYSLFVDDFTIGSYKWNVMGCFANNTFSNCTTSASNSTFSVESSPFDFRYNNYVWETSYQPFSVNLSLFSDLNFYGGKLVYENIEYTANISNIGGNNYYISKSIDVPAGSGNKTFYWKFIYSLGGGSFAYQTTANYSQNLSQIYLKDCPSSAMTLNFSFYDEENATELNTADFYGSFQYWLGTGTTYKTVSFSNLGVSEKNICIIPNQTYYSNSIIQYEKTGYVKRNYYLNNATLNNVTNNINLYLLLTTKATSFIISVKNANQLPIADALIYVQRYYPGTNTYATVAMGKTDNSGNTVSSFEAETEDYRIIVIKNGEVIYTSPIQKVYCSATPCTLPIQVSGGGVVGWSKIGNLSNLIYFGPTLNSTSGIITYTYIDTSGTTHYGRMWVYLLNSANGKQTICDVNSTQSAATLTCDVSGVQGTIYAEVFISRSPEVLVWVESWVLNNIKSIMGFEGLFWAMLIILVLAIGGAAMGGIGGGIIGTFIGFIGVTVIGVASFGMITIWSIIILGVLVLWAIKS